MITLTNGQDVTAAANVKFMHNDNEVNVGTLWPFGMHFQIFLFLSVSNGVTRLAGAGQ